MFVNNKLTINDKNFMYKEAESFPLLKIARSGVVDQSAVLRKTGAMTGAVPAVFLSVPLQGASQMRTPGCSGCQQIFRRFQKIDPQLFVQHASGGGEDFCIGIAPALHKVCQNLCGDHGGGHAPFTESGCHIEIGGVLTVLSDIGDAVQRHTVLRCPVVGNYCAGIIFLYL